MGEARRIAPLPRRSRDCCVGCGKAVEQVLGARFAYPAHTRVSGQGLVFLRANDGESWLCGDCLLKQVEV